MSDFNRLAPELALIVTFMGTLVLSIFATPLQRPAWRVVPTVLGLLACIALVGLSAPSDIVVGFHAQLAFDPLARFCKLLVAIAALTAVLAAALSDELPACHLGEYLALLIAMTLGLFLMISANHLLMLFLGMELTSLMSYALAGFRLHDRQAREAAMKYVIYGSVASALMLYGMSLLYGMCGSLDLGFVQGRLAHPGHDGPLFLAAMLLVLAGVGFKITVVPFHMWAPDVYQGAPTPFVGFLAVGPKAAGFALLCRILAGVYATLPARATAPLLALLAIVAVVTMTLGNLSALAQHSVKRLLAYSSIAHAGYVLMALAAPSPAALHAVLFYLVVYYLMTAGAFLVCQGVRDQLGGDTLEHFAGLSSRSPALAIAMAIFLFSLTGLPPVAGFLGKFYLFAAVLAQGGPWYTTLAVIAGLNSALALYYYLRVVRAMFQRDAVLAPVGAAPGRAYGLLVACLAVPSLVLCLNWSPLSQLVQGSLGLYRPRVAEVGYGFLEPQAP